MDAALRLSPVLKVRSDAELAARRRLAAAVAEREAALRAAEHARELANGGPHVGGSAWMLDVVEVGHRRSLDDLKKAEERVAKTEQVTEAAREAQVDAKKKMKVIERIIEERKMAVARERERKEQRDLDERASARF